jgi:hypothetical protein
LQNDYGVRTASTTFETISMTLNLAFRHSFINRLVLVVREAAERARFPGMKSIPITTRSRHPDDQGVVAVQTFNDEPIILTEVSDSRDWIGAGRITREGCELSTFERHTIQ